MNIDGLIVALHIFCGAALFMTTIIMQLVVSRALSRVSPGEGKAAAQEFIMTRWHPVVDVFILLLTATAVYMLMTRMEMIGQSPWLMAKITFGGITLTLVNLLHFYWRGKKKRMKRAGQTEALAALTKRTTIFERTVMVTATITFIMGIMFNHL